MKKKWKWPALGVVILVVAILLGKIFWNGKEIVPTTVEQTVKTVQAATVDKESVIIGTGNIEAFEKADISSKINGRVNQAGVENGNSVAKGETLVVLDNAEQTNNLLTAQSNLNKSRINLQDKQKNYERYQALYNQGAISLKDLEGTKTQLDTSQADVQVAQAAVANAQEALNNTTITSPIAGIVANKNVTQGQVVAPGTPLMTVQGISSVYIVVNVEQGNISQVKQGMNAEITVDACPDRTFKGSVEIINPVADQAARMFEVKIKVENPDLVLKPGMFAKVKLSTGNVVKVVAIPQEAILGKEGQYFVFTVEGDHAKRQAVEIGQIMDRNIEIKSGLSQGQQVIITNVNKLKDQDLIRIAND